MIKIIRTILILLIMSPLAFSQFKLQGKVISSGAVNASGDGFKVEATVGQPAIGSTSNHSLTHFAGFWYQSIEIVTSVDEVEEETVPEIFQLEQNYPNPFNPTTTIQFSVPVASDVTIKLYDILGREVAVLTDDAYQPGVYKINFEAGSLPSGMYIYRLHAEGFVQTRKLMLLK